MSLQESVKGIVTEHEKALLESFIQFLAQQDCRIGEYYCSCSNFELLSEEQLNRQVDAFLQLRSEQPPSPNHPKKEVIDWEEFGSRLRSHINDCLSMIKPLSYNQWQVILQMVSDAMQIPSYQAPILDKVQHIEDAILIHLRCPKMYDPSNPHVVEAYRTFSVQLG